MRVDPQTLRDLEIFQTSTCVTGIFDHLDFTQTHQGRKRLRQRFEQPPATATELRDLQRAVRFLGAHTELRWQLDRSLTDAVESYLSSNFVGITARSSVSLAAVAWWYEQRYPDIVQKLRSGVSAVQHLFGAIQELVGAIAAARPPDGVLLHHVNICAQELGQSGFDRLTRATRGISRLEVLAWDSRLRGELGDSLRRLLDSTYELDALMAIALATPWLFVARARTPSWRDALAVPAGVVVFVAGTIVVALLERRARLARHRTWLPTMVAFLIVLAAAMIGAAVYPDHPWKEAVYVGVLFGALQSWMTWERMRMSGA